MARKRVEVLYPTLIGEVVLVASKHGAAVFGINEKSVQAALARHYSGGLRDELDEANDQLDGMVGRLDDANDKLASVLVHNAALREQLEVKHRELLEAERNLEDMRDTARVGYEPPSEVTHEPLFHVQAVQSLAAVNGALRDGASIAELQGQLVVVRPLQVYDYTCAAMQATTVLAEGACVGTVDGLAKAGLPVPRSPHSALDLLSQFVRHTKQGDLRFTTPASVEDREQFDQLVNAANALLAGGPSASRAGGR